jgi:HSP20 family molecular chaperone IbpA
VTTYSNDSLILLMTAAENYVKVSFGSYLLELDLMGGIDDTKVKATAKNGNLILKLQKVGGCDHIISLSRYQFCICPP